MSPKKTKKRDILEKVMLSFVHLQKIDGESFLPIKPQIEVDLNTDWTCNVKSHEKDKLVLSADFRMFFTPESVFKIYLSYVITYRCLEELTTDQIKANMETLVRPCSALNSLLVGILTEKFGGLPIILNPEATLTNEC